MNNYISNICEIILLLLIGYHFVSSFFSKDKSLIWSPISVISLTYIYYCSIPFWLGTIDKYQIDESLVNGYLFHIATLLSYSFILIGFNCSSNTSFTKWNTIFSRGNSGKIGMILFLIAMICYVPFRGLHFSVYGDSSPRPIVNGGFVYYFIFMTNMFAIASALILIELKNGGKKLLLFVLVMIIIQLFFAGARWLIAVTGLTVLSTYYLYPIPKKINLPLFVILGFVIFMVFSIMDKTRQRGSGINKEAVKSLTYEDIKGGAEENYGVYWFSLMAINNIEQTGERVYFQPFVTALLMPIPRAIFPWKPDEAYLDKIEETVFGDSLGGAAFLNYVEYFMAFGWFGVIFMSWFWGWIARKFWDNYKNNPMNISAIVALSAMSAVFYAIISRGYMASTVTNILLVVCLPFWISSLLKKYIDSH